MIKFYDDKQLNNKSTEELIELQKELRHVVTARKFAAKAPRKSDVEFMKKYELQLEMMDAIISKRQAIEASGRSRKGSHDKRARRDAVSLKRGYNG